MAALPASFDSNFCTKCRLQALGAQRTHPRVLPSSSLHEDRSCIARQTRTCTEMSAIGKLLNCTLFRPAGVARPISHHLASALAPICGRSVTSELGLGLAAAESSKSSFKRPIYACATAAAEAPTMAGTLEHSSYANAADIVVTHNDFELDVDFTSKTINGTAKVGLSSLAVLGALQIAFAH